MFKSLIFSMMLFSGVAQATDPTQSCGADLAQVLSDCTAWNNPGHPTYATYGPRITSISLDGSTYSWEAGCTQDSPSNPGHLEGLNTGACVTSIPIIITSPPPGPPPRCMGGSTIRVEELSVGEKVHVAGTPFDLTYNSVRAFGNTAKFLIHAESNGTPASGQTGTKFQFDYETSRSDVQTISSTTGTYYNFYWDGLNASAAPIQGGTRVDVTSTLMFGSTPASVPQQRQLYLPSWNAKFVGLGGWNLSIHHFMDSQGLAIHFGDGSMRDVRGGGGSLSPDQSELYTFDIDGKHLTTKNALTGATLYTFNYDSNDLLLSVVDAYGNTTTITRNGSGVLTGIVSPYGQTTTLAVDGNGYLSSIQNPNSETYSMTYYTGGLLHTFQKPNGQVSTMTYDGHGNLTQDSSSAGNYLDLILTMASNTDKTINMSTASGYASSVVMNSAYGYSSRVDTSRTNHQISTIFNPGAYVNTTEGAIKYTSAYMVSDDRWGPSIKTVGSFQEQVGSNTRTSYFSRTPHWTAPLPDGLNYDTIVYSDVLGSINIYGVFTRSTGVTTITSGGMTGSMTTDTYGRLTSKSEASFLPKTFSYDIKGRLSQILQGSRQTDFTYNSGGFLSTITNPLSQVTSFTYDLAGRLATRTLPDSRVVSYAYDSNGNLSNIVVPSTSIHQFSWNNFDLNSVYTPPALGLSTVATTYSYNNDKQLTQILRPDTSTIVPAYNSTTGLLTSLTTTMGNYSFTFNAAGDLDSGTSPDSYSLQQYFSGHDVNYTVNSNASSQDIGGIQVSFNSDLQKSNISVHTSGGTSSINFTYYGGILNGAGAEGLTLSASTGLVTKSTLNKIQESFTYDSNFGEKASASTSYVPTSGSPTALFSQSYTRDYLGRISAMTETTNGVTNNFAYTYDSTGRLTDVTKNSVAFSHYNFDSNNNRTSGNAGGVSITATYDAHDRVVTYNTKTFTHNLNGERTTKVVGASTTTYTYDTLGNLKSVALPGSTISYHYDALNRRVTRKTGSTVNAYYVYQDQTKVEAVLNSSRAITHRFIYGMRSNVPDYVVRSGTTYRIISDAQGSVRLVVNASTGAVSQRMDYDEFGNVTNDTSPGFQPFGYAGGLYDASTGLVHFGARDYDPETGRWLRKDPIGFGSGLLPSSTTLATNSLKQVLNMRELDSLERMSRSAFDSNLYGYTFNDPINYIDPNGRWGVGLIVGLILGPLVIHDAWNMINGGPLICDPAVKWIDKKLTEWFPDTWPKTPPPSDENSPNIGDSYTEGSY